MKKMLCLLLCGMLLLAGCNRGGEKMPAATTPTTSTGITIIPTTVVTTTAVPTTTAPPVVTVVATTTTISEDESWERIFDECIQEFLQAWQAGDADGLWRYTGSEDMAALLAESVAVEAHRLEKSTDDKPHRLHLSVSESELPSVPKGESEWWIRASNRYDGIYVELCPIDEDYNARWAYLEMDDDLAVRFCAEMATELELFETVPDFSRLSPEELGARGGTLVRLYNAWLKATEPDADLPSHLPEKTLSKFTEVVMGVTVTDFSASRTYIPATETKEAQVELEGYGGKWYYGGLVDRTQDGDAHTITIRYYADAARLVEAVTMRYSMRELEDGQFRMLSCERLSGGTYPPVRGTT